ncbi:hypothetical protein L345_17921, partial [Ophiophagus hannah]
MTDTKALLRNKPAQRFRKSLPSSDASKMAPEQKARYLAFADPTKPDVKTMLAAALMKERKVLDNQQREVEDKNLIGVLKASEARNRLRNSRLQYQHLRVSGLGSNPGAGGPLTGPTSPLARVKFLHIHPVSGHLRGIIPSPTPPSLPVCKTQKIGEFYVLTQLPKHNKPSDVNSKDSFNRNAGSPGMGFYQFSPVRVNCSILCFISWFSSSADSRNTADCPARSVANAVHIHKTRNSPNRLLHQLNPIHAAALAKSLSCRLTSPSSREMNSCVPHLFISVPCLLSPELGWGFASSDFHCSPLPCLLCIHASGTGPSYSSFSSSATSRPAAVDSPPEG